MIAITHGREPCSSDHLPPGDLIVDRFSSRTMLINLMLSSIGPSALDEFTLYADGRRRGMSDSGTSGGSFLNVYQSSEGVLFYGGVKRKLNGAKSVEAEKAMHAALRELPPSLNSIVRKRNPKSLGVTFGAYWCASTRNWRDLTGYDPELVHAKSIPEASRLYAEIDSSWARKVSRQLEIPDAADTVLNIFSRRPLTAEMCRQVMKPFVWPKAVDIASLCGYPIASL
ncbi:MAG: hypothetical protein HEQ23_10925 [Tepidisphaera sp.]